MYYDIPDYRLEPPEYEERETPCPVCDEDCKTIYLNKQDDELGCEQCIKCEYAWDWLFDQGRLPKENPEEHTPVCPMCKKECEFFYCSNDEIVACENCIECKDAYDWYTKHNWFSWFSWDD